MKREIVEVTKVFCCCPGHDNFPNETYKSNRSKRARSRDIKIKHRYVRRILSQQLIKEISKELNDKVFKDCCS